MVNKKLAANKMSYIFQDFSELGTIDETNVIIADKQTISINDLSDTKNWGSTNNYRIVRPIFYDKENSFSFGEIICNNLGYHDDKKYIIYKGSGNKIRMFFKEDYVVVSPNDVIAKFFPPEERRK